MKHHLKEHTLIHSGEMPFSCHLCPKRFNRSYTLKNHMKLHSAGNIQEKFQVQ
jgi:KRAB domain-containing zinc finger protein